MKGLDEIIKKNRELLSVEEPSDAHFDNFQKKLSTYHQGRESWLSRHGLVLRIAAAALIFIILGVFYYSQPLKGLKQIFSQQVADSGLPIELQEAMQYYNIVTDKRLGQIAQYTSSTDEADKVEKMALKELENLDNDKLELEAYLVENPSNERIQNALVINSKKQAEILNRIINALQKTQQ